MTYHPIYSLLLTMDNPRARGTHKKEQDAQHHSVQCAITNAVMPSMWMTRNRMNPGNGTVDSFWGTGTGHWHSGSTIHGNGTLITLIKPWCSVLECLQNDAFSVLHSTRAGCPLDTLKIYWNDPKEPSRTCLTANTLETDLLWTYLVINLIYIFHLLSCIKTCCSLPCTVD